MPRSEKTKSKDWEEYAMRALATVVTCVLATVSAWGMELAGEWPQWRGIDQDGKAVSETFEIGKDQGLKVLWKKELGSGYSSITLMNKRAYVMFSDGTHDFIAALNADDGEEVWRFKLDETYRGHDGSHDGTISTPACDGKRVFGLGPKGQLVALDAQNGKEIWSTTMKSLESVEPYYGWSTSPLLFQDTVIVMTGNQAGSQVTAFERQSGKIRWTTGEDVINYQSPSLIEIHGQLQLLCSGDNWLLGLDPNTGKRLWDLEHKGGYQASQPIAAGENRVYLRHAGGEGMMVAVEKTDDGLAARELWKSTQIKNTNNVSIYHEGHLYGYSGQFLTCMNAETGQRVWRSRPPGDGFTILVNDKLVIITKAGTLHVAEASPKGYEEVASVEVVEGLGWNPASFAYDKIYLRNLKEIACVGVADVEQVMVKQDDPDRGKLSGSKFAKFVAKVEASDHPEKMVQDYLAKQKAFPVVEGKNKVHILFHGEVEDIAITGDMVEAGGNVPLNRVGDTDLYYYSFEVEPDTILGYQLIKNFEEQITDPRNPHKGPTFQQEQSILAMPGWSGNLAFDAERELNGRLDSFEFESKVMENKRQIQVYLPAGYDKSEERYPVLYNHYGKMALEKGMVHQTLDQLAGKSVRPTIAVFVHLNPDNGYREVSGNLKDKYVEMFAKELVPYIDEKYRTTSQAKDRGMLGFSAGGYISIYTALKQPGVFGFVAGQSTNVDSPRDEELKQLIADTPKIDTRFYIDWGRYDLRQEQAGLDRAGVNRALFKQLKDKGYKTLGGEVNSGYGWGVWRTRVGSILETAFPQDTMQKSSLK